VAEARFASKMGLGAQRRSTLTLSGPKVAKINSPAQRWAGCETMKWPVASAMLTSLSRLPNSV
jgi:hypothetical protein